MRVNPHFYADMFIFTKEFLTGNLMFCALSCASKYEKTNVKKKITYFLKNYVASLFGF